MSTALNPALSTLPARPSLPARAVADEARAQAQAAADAAAVTIRELSSPKDHDAAADAIARIWSVEPGQSLMPSTLMRVLAHEGCYVAGVFDDQDDGRMIGTAVGFLASDGEGQGHGIHLHSHIAGVLPEAKGRHAGFALKLHQRAWALSRGIDRITWTFDPLVRGNAYFNLAKLGAQAVSYLVDFYGETMHDGVNVGQGSDRLLMQWELTSPRVIAAANGKRVDVPDVEPLLTSGRALLSGIDEDVSSHAVSLLDESGTSGPLLCATPAAIQALRHEAREQARRWRFAVRGALTEAVASGYRVAGFSRSGWYLLDHEARGEDR